MTDVFISYSRRDKAFVRALCHALQEHNHQLWVDWDGIRSSLPWREEISNGIRQATRLIYILSPDTIASQYCNWEIDQALKLQKKLIPILCRDVDISTVRPEIASLQFISFCGDDNFATALEKLEGAISADLEYDRTFAKLGQRAQEWLNRDRNDGWLRGADLEDAEVWLANSIGKTPPPSDLQREYILASRQERQAELERWQMLYEVAEKGRITAEKNEIHAFCKSSEAFFALDRPLDALMEALQAGERLRQVDWAEDLASLRAQVIGALQQSLYWVRECNRLEGHNGTVRAVSISPDGELIVTGSRDSTLRLWQRNGHCLAVLQGHEKLVRTVVFAPDGQSFVSGSWDSTIRIWSRSGEEQKILREHGDRVIQLAFSPEGDCFASASSDGTVKLWTSDGQLVASAEHDGIEQRCVVFSPDGQILANGSKDGKIHLWSITGDRQLTRQLTLDVSARALNTLCFSHDGQQLFSGGEDGHIRIWHCAQNIMQDMTAQRSEVRAIQMMPERDKIVSASSDGRLYIWHCPNQVWKNASPQSEIDPPDSDLSEVGLNDALQTTLIGHSGPVLGLDIDRTGELLLSAGGERVVRLWKWQVPHLVHCKTGGVGSYGLNFDPNAEQLVVCGKGNAIQIWHHKGTLQHEFIAHSSKVLNVCMSSQGDVIATADNSKSIKLWSNHGELQVVLPGHQDWPRQLCFSPDGLLLASASDDGTVRLWSRDGTLQRIFHGENDRFTSVCFAPNGQSLVAGSRNRVLRHWWLDGALEQTFVGHNDEVLSVAFSPDGSYLLSASDDRTARIWNLDGTLVNTLECQRSVRSVDISPNGEVVATGCRDGVIRLWSMEGVLLSTLHGRSGQLIRVCFSPDGTYLAATSDEGMLTIWQFDNFDEGLLERLIDKGLNWCSDYLETNPNGQDY